MRGGVPERSKGTDCKSVGYAFEGSNPSPSTNRPGFAVAVVPLGQVECVGSSLATDGAERGLVNVNWALGFAGVAQW